MAIVNRPVLEYSGHQSENLIRAIRTLGEHVKELSMGEVRLVVCKVSGGSYACLARFLSRPSGACICLSIDEALMHRGLINAVKDHLTSTELRKIVTWSGDLLRDLEALERSQNEVTAFGTQWQRGVA